MLTDLKKYVLESIPLNPKILDLGCGNPVEIFCWFKEFKIAKNKYFSYIGVDKAEKFNLLINPNNNVQEKWEFTDIDWINSINNSICIDIDEENDFSIDLNLFKKYFKFHFNTNVVEFVRSLEPNNRFDFIILSNILDKLNKQDADFVFDKCLSLISEEGIIYVSVLGNEYLEKKDWDNLYNYQEYIRMKEKIKVLWYSEHSRYNFKFIGNKL